MPDPDRVEQLNCFAFKVKVLVQVPLRYSLFESCEEGLRKLLVLGRVWEEVVDDSCKELLVLGDELGKVAVADSLQNKLVFVLVRLLCFVDSRSQDDGLDGPHAVVVVGLGGQLLT